VDGSGRGPFYRQAAERDRLGLGAAFKSERSERLAPRVRHANTVTKSVCPYCAVGCGQNVYVKDGKVIQIEGDPDSPVSRGRLCPKGSASLQLTTGGAREYQVRYWRPFGTDWEDLDLDTAMDMIADRVIAAWPSAASRCRVQQVARAGALPGGGTTGIAASRQEPWTLTVMLQAARVVDNRGMLSPSVTPEPAPESGRAPRVVLADDDVLLREGLASLLDRSGFDVVGQAGNGPGLLALVRSAQPDLAIIDIRMPPAQATEGLGAARVIRAELPGTAIIVLSAHVEVDEAIELLAGGERLGYLLKSRVTDVAEFIDTVERITAGASVVDPSLVQELVMARRRRDPLDVLSPRERDVLALMAEGASNAGVARRIFVTEGTVEKHVRSILTKLNLPESDTEHRRVLAVLRFLEAR
jgi:DNA-binding NarL/FixJ family response regulator